MTGIQLTGLHPNALAEKIAQVTNRRVIVQLYDEFFGFLVRRAKTPPELLPYNVLTNLFPRSIQAVLDGDEKVPSTRGADPLLFLVREFSACSHAACCLYERHPVIDSVWNDAMYDHVRLWTSTACPICEVKGMKPS